MFSLGLEDSPEAINGRPFGAKDSCMQVDAAIGLMVLVVEAQHGLLGMGRPEPALLLAKYTFACKFHVQERIALIR